MNKKLTTSLFVILLANSVIYAQSGDVEMDLRLGLGMVSFQPELHTTLAIEAELNKKLTPYFTVAPSFIYDNTNEETGKDDGLLQLNLNGFVSPFRNNRRNDFRLGGGIGYSFLTVNRYQNRNSLGFNIIVENSFSITEKYFIGIKGYAQHFINRGNAWGLMLKVGMEF